MEIYFGIVLVVSAIYFIWWALACTITNGGLLGTFTVKVIPLILGISLLFMLTKGLGWV